MKELINQISGCAICLNGRYEYREMSVLIDLMMEGKDILKIAAKLKTVVKQFEPASLYEIGIKKSLLSSIDNLLNTNENVQSSKTPKNGTGSQKQGSADAQNETFGANPVDETVANIAGSESTNNVIEPAATSAETIVETPVVEEPVEQPAETIVENPVVEEPAETIDEPVNQLNSKPSNKEHAIDQSNAKHK